MKIAFHGAARTVTGSKHLLTLDNEIKILLDCGMFQGMGNETDALNREFGFDASEVSCVLLTHAHIDHCGLLPKLVKEGFKGKIFCTAATRDLAIILLKDSANIQQQNAQENERKEEVSAEPFYDVDDVYKTIPLFSTVKYNDWLLIEKGIEALFTDAGHIVGSAAVHLRITENGNTEQITFSGDVGRFRDLMLKPPQQFPQSDYIILESTYGNSLHEAMFNATDRLMDVIFNTCVNKKGKLIIPAFSVGRTQELLYLLNQLSLEKRLPEIPVFVDSPLSKAATEIVKHYPYYFNDYLQKVLEMDDDPFDFPGLHFTEKVYQSILLKKKVKPCIIISASGMASAGRVRHHIANNIESEKNTILIVGYCDPPTLGGQLMSNAKKVNIFGKEYNVNAEIVVLRSMSAHGDYDDLCQFLSCQNSELIKRIFLVHGEYGVQAEFMKRLLAKGYKDVHIPDMHEVCGLVSTEPEQKEVA
jgi:metallo-beta-lactamase family protein